MKRVLKLKTERLNELTRAELHLAGGYIPPTLLCGLADVNVSNGPIGTCVCVVVSDSVCGVSQCNLVC